MRLPDRPYPLDDAATRLAKATMRRLHAQYEDTAPREVVAAAAALLLLAAADCTDLLATAARHAGAGTAAEWETMTELAREAAHWCSPLAGAAPAVSPPDTTTPEAERLAHSLLGKIFENKSTG